MSDFSPGGPTTRSAPVLLLRPPLWNTVSAETPPLGLGYLLAALKRDGLAARMIDFSRVPRGGALVRETLQRDRPRVVGVQVYSNEIEAANKTIELVRSIMGDRATIVVGGPHVSTMPRETLGHLPGADFGLRGEGEITFARLARGVIDAGEVDRHLPALVFRADGGVQINEPEFVADLDQLAPPDWDGMGIERYHADAFGGGFNRRSPAMCIVTSRGCPFRCGFCAANPVSGRVYRRHSGARVVAEMKALYERGYREIKIVDDNFAVDPRHVRDVRAAMEAERLDLAVSFACGLHLLTITEETVDHIKAMGVYEVMVAIEAGTDRVLRDMCKDIDLALVREKIALLRKHELPITGYFILGYPGETRADLEQTVRLALELPLVRVHFNAFSPYPGSQIYEQLRAAGRLDEIELRAVHAERANYSFVDGLSIRDLNRIRRRALLRFYLRPRILWGFMRGMNSWPIARFRLRKGLEYFGLLRNKERTKELE